MPRDNDAWTLVQHSGYGYAGNGQFAMAVEEVMLTNKRQRKTVTNAGGVVFKGYLHASDAAMDANYQNGKLNGIIPFVKGTFAPRNKIKDLRIYRPTAEELRRWAQKGALVSSDGDHS